MAQLVGGGKDKGKVEIVDVWNHNIEAELELIRGILPDFPIVAVTTSPGGASPYPTSDSSYETLRVYMDKHRFGQITLAFTNPAGNLALRRFWRFHIGDLRPDDAGVEVPAGSIEPTHLLHALMAYGVTGNPKFTWVICDGAADLAFLIKCHIPCSRHPPRRDIFALICYGFFPVIYDLKVLAMHGELDHHPPMEAAAQSDSNAKTIVPAFLGDQTSAAGVERYRGIIFGFNHGTAP